MKVSFTLEFARELATELKLPGHGQYDPRTSCIIFPKCYSVSSMTKKKLHLYRDWCKGCGICIAFCPKNVLELDKDEKITAPRIDDCLYCGLCEFRCPDFALEVKTEEEGGTS